MTMDKFTHQLTLPEGAFFHLFRGDAEATDGSMTPAGEFTIYKAKHATYGQCVGISGGFINGLVFSERKIPAHYPHKRRADAPKKAA